MPSNGSTIIIKQDLYISFLYRSLLLCLTVFCLDICYVLGMRFSINQPTLSTIFSLGFLFLLLALCLIIVLVNSVVSEVTGKNVIRLSSKEVEVNVLSSELNNIPVIYHSTHTGRIRLSRDSVYCFAFNNRDRYQPRFTAKLADGLIIPICTFMSYSITENELFKLLEAWRSNASDANWDTFCATYSPKARIYERFWALFLNFAAWSIVVYVTASLISSFPLKH